MNDLLQFATKAIQILGLLGVTAAAIAAAGFGIFRWLGAKWLDAKFSERLENYRHQQQRELEQLKLEINTLFDRTLKLHQREFEILPEMWSRLTKAFGTVHSLISPLQTYPNLDKMGESQLLEFLATSNLAEWQKSELKDGDEKTNRYVRFITWHELGKALATHRDFHNYLVMNGIFLPESLRAEFYRVSEMIDDAIRERQMAATYPDSDISRYSKAERLSKDGSELVKSIETALRSRLWSRTESPLS